jgi:hypothetical protein
VIHTGEKLRKLIRERNRTVIIDKAIEEAAGEIAWEPCRCEDQPEREAGQCVVCIAEIIRRHLGPYLKRPDD